jgi:hypothetical protein
MRRVPDVYGEVDAVSKRGRRQIRKAEKEYRSEYLSDIRDTIRKTDFLISHVKMSLAHYYIMQTGHHRVQEPEMSQGSESVKELCFSDPPGSRLTHSHWKVPRYHPKTVGQKRRATEVPTRMGSPDSLSAIGSRERGADFEGVRARSQMTPRKDGGMRKSIDSPRSLRERRVRLAYSQPVVRERASSPEVRRRPS